MKKIIIILVLLLFATIVLADGMGVINMDFGDVTKKTTIQREFRFFPFDTDYEPYTDVSKEGVTAIVEIYKTGNLPHLQIEEGLYEVPINEYTRLMATLYIPPNAKRGDYSGRICAVGSCPDEYEGMCLRVGACASVSYNITNEEIVCGYVDNIRTRDVIQGEPLRILVGFLNCGNIPTTVIVKSNIIKENEIIKTFRRKFELPPYSSDTLEGQYKRTNELDKGQYQVEVKVYAGEKGKLNLLGERTINFLVT